MKDYLATLALAAVDPAHGRNLVREYLQARILSALQSAEQVQTDVSPFLERTADLQLLTLDNLLSVV